MPELDPDPNSANRTFKKPGTVPKPRTSPKVGTVPKPGTIPKPGTVLKTLNSATKGGTVISDIGCANILGCFM